MANFYLVTFDPHKTDPIGLHKVIENMYIMTWWHYLGSTYIIKTDRTLQAVAEEITEKWPKQRFLIVKIDPKIRNGWLPPDAWKWFKNKVD